MKKSNLMLAFAVIVFAVGSAFVTQSSKDAVLGKSGVSGEIAQTGYYKVPNEPCGQMFVACNPIPETPLCLLPVPNQPGTHQIYQSDCITPLYRD